MLDHPAISNPEYTTTILAWEDGGFTFFEGVSYGSDGFVILDAFYLAYLTVFVVSILLLRWWQKRGSLRIHPALCLDTVLVAVAGAAFGGRLGEAVFYNPDYFFSEPSRLITNASGMTIHGVIIGAVVALWLWSRWIRKPFLHILDQGTIIIAFGTILGRVANFLAGELWGRATDLPWAMRFWLRGYLSRPVYANGAGDTFELVRDVTKPGEVVAYLKPAAVDQGYEVLRDRPANMFPVGNEPNATYQFVWRCVTDPRHPSQLYQALADGLLLLILMIVIRSRAKTVGVLTSSFLILYGVIRTATELFRQPEPGLGFVFGLITRGQLLSLCMVVAGVLVAGAIRRKPLLIADIPLTEAKPQTAESPSKQP